MSSRTTSSVALALLAIALLALWTRVQYVDLYGGRTESYSAWANEHYFGGLSEFYLTTADALARGEAYTALHHPPGYPYLLAALKAAGFRSVGAIRIAQCVFDAAIVVVFYQLARWLGVTRAWALAAAAAYAVWPLFAEGATWPLADSLTVGLVAITLWVLVLAARVRGPRGVATASACGAIIGASVLVRPDLLLLIVPAAAWVVFAGSDRAAARVVALLIACAIPIGVWGVHNRATHGVWVFGSTSSGLVLWEGLGEIPNGYGYVLDDSAANHVLMAKGLTWSSVDADRYFRREYLNAWRAHPIFVARVIAARVPHILFQSEHLQPLFFGRARQLVDLAGVLFVAIVVVLRRRDHVAWLVLLLPPLYAIGSIGLVHYEPRYVRYVQLSYLLAGFVIASELWRRLDEFNSVLAVSVTSVVVSAAGLYAARELHALHVAAAVALR